MKHVYKIFLVVLVASVFTGCNLDVNTDPNRTTAQTVTGALIFPSAVHQVGQRAASGNFSSLDKWLGYWAASGTFAIDFTETTYDITPTFQDNGWINHYNTLFDLDQCRTKSLADGDSLTAGASIILSAKLWQELVDMFGNIPYTQAFQFTKYPTPDYTLATDVYADLQTQLDNAILLMSAKAPKASFLTTDIAIARVMKTLPATQNRWIQFANTLKLRLLIRQSEIAGFDPSSEITKINNTKFNNLVVGFLGAGQTVSVNPGYAKATNKQSPFYANYGLTVNNADAAPSLKANNYYIKLMTATLDTFRLKQQFTPLPPAGKGPWAKYVIGNTYGLAAGNPLASSAIGAGLANNDAQDQWIMTSVESLFLVAEATERGWIAGSASAAYNAAVTESFAWLGASAGAGAYLAKYPYGSTPAADVQAGVTQDNIERLLFQKYIALNGIDPLETWADLRRYGYNCIPLTSNGGAYSYISINPSKKGGGVLPARYKLAQSEYTTNSVHALAQGTIDQFTTKIFWDVKD